MGRPGIPVTPLVSFIAGTVIDDQTLPVTVGLRPNARDARGQEPRLVVTGDDDRDERGHRYPWPTHLAAGRNACARSTLSPQVPDVARATCPHAWRGR